MKVFHSDSYRAELSADGILDVFALDGKTIKEVSFNGNKISVKEHTAKKGAPSLRSLLDVMDNCPVFRAAFAQNEVFYVDYETGTQRFKCYAETNELENKLIKFKFSAKDIELILQKCKQTQHTHLPKVG